MTESADWANAVELMLRAVNAMATNRILDRPRLVIAAGAVALLASGCAGTGIGLPGSTPQPAVTDWGLPPFVSAEVTPDGVLVADVEDAATFPLRAQAGGGSYDDFLSKSPRGANRAVALSSDGSGLYWSWDARRDASRSALARCERAEFTDCKLYAVNSRIVWNPRRTDPVPIDVIPPPQPDADTFTYAGMLTGATTTEAACETKPDSVWAAVGGSGECLRYFKAGEAAENDIAVLFMQGDGIWQLFAEGRLRGVALSDSSRWDVEHPTTTPHRLAEGMRYHSAVHGGQPFFNLSRPGVRGSSGNQWRDKGSERETAVVDAALDGLKDRYGVRQWALVGQSHGGTLVANLLARRKDIACAVLASGSLSAKADKRSRGAPSETIARLLDPMETLASVDPADRARIFVVTDPGDTVVKAEFQEPWYRAAKARGLDATFITRDEDTGENRHYLGPAAISIGAFCAQGMPTGEIVRRIEAGEMPPEPSFNPDTGDLLTALPGS